MPGDSCCWIDIYFHIVYFLSCELSVTTLSAYPDLMDNDPDKVSSAFMVPRHDQEELRTNDVKVKQSLWSSCVKRGAQNCWTPLWLAVAAVAVCLLLSPFKYFSHSAEEPRSIIPISSQTPSILPIVQPDTNIKMSNEQTYVYRPSRHLPRLQ